ncbi:MAG: ABC transporter permease [Clostridiales bacterium]|nr:ABC transporter permease [Clostridiales bacterium]
MIITFRDALKFAGIIITVCCAVFVCNLFLNYGMDLNAVADAVSGSQQATFSAMQLNNKVVCAVTGVCLAFTSGVLLVFYIGHYIKRHSSRFGILKALGYGEAKVAAGCAVFGLCAFIGAAAGYALSWALMTKFYAVQGEGKAMPEVVMRFHPVLLLTVILPTVFYTALSVLIAYFKLKAPALSLIRGETVERKVKQKKDRGDRKFLTELAFCVFGERKSLVFFVGFGCFCFSTMTQMGLSMRSYADEMIGAMILIIGLILAAMSLLLALGAVVGGNAKTLAMMKVNGYTLKESAVAVLGLYHIPAAIGFAVGCVYQWGVLNIMVNIVFSSVEGTIPYAFDWKAFGICVAVFAVAYELLNLLYAIKINKTPVKAVMSE